MSKGSLKTLVGLPLSFHEMSSPSASRLVLRTLNLAMPFAWTDFSHLGFSVNVTSSERPSLICVFIAYYLHPSHSFSLHFALGAQSTQCPALCNSTRLLCPCDSSGKNTGVDCHFLLYGIFLTQALNLSLVPCCTAVFWRILYHRATFQFYFRGGDYEYWVALLVLQFPLPLRCKLFGIKGVCLVHHTIPRT